jgi:hypothetical protein
MLSHVKPLSTLDEWCDNTPNGGKTLLAPRAYKFDVKTQIRCKLIQRFERNVASEMLLYQKLVKNR